MSIYYQTATQIVSGIKNKKFSVREVMEAHLDRIKETNDKVNAIVSLDEEKAMKGARIADERLAKGHRDVGPLFGLPTAIKDTHNAQGYITYDGIAYL